ncbi:MAG: type II secretory ATPase GspE/PulE/Tfp pilus assembly ATPase PilB-like protein [Verrucomicrobiales bacterium]|jgi:type II secretory ATPase GspE/PulE/Tfp pilus assembly ATPase PilB-like protein
MGPLIVLGHYNPAFTEVWGIPACLTIRVVLEQGQYSKIREDLENRLEFKQLPPSNALETLEPPSAELDYSEIMEWFATNYPMEEIEAEKFGRLVSENSGSDIERYTDYKGVPRHIGVALHYLRTGEFCFNPEETGSQDTFPDQLLEKHGVYPMFMNQEKVYLLSSSPAIYAFEDEWLSMGHDPIEVIPVMADPEAILAAIERNRGKGALAQVGDVDFGELSLSENVNLVEIDPIEMSRLNPQNPNNTPEQLIHWILYRAVTSRGSDLHVEKYFNTARFRARIDGSLKVIHSCSEEMLPRFIALFKNYSNMGHAHQTLQDARFAMSIGKKRIDVRVSAVPCRKENQKLTMRFLDKQDGIKELSELNLSQRQSGIITQTMGRDQGLVLVTGPTGSGKTTTLYAFLNSINEDSLNIHTIEDPIEYEIEGINQTQTDAFNGINFATGLRALLRADPDVMLVGESRDAETAMASINAALTGHLVLTTLHANDSLRAVSRLISMGVEPYLLSDALALSQAQRLVKRLCAYCKKPVQAPQELQEFFYKNGVIKAQMTEPIYEKAGCDECNMSGYTGRVALMEMTLFDAEMSEMISEGASMTVMRKGAAARGVLSLYQEGMIQVVAGTTTMEEIQSLSHFGAMS